MEKDKLMELINEMTERRKKVINNIEKERILKLEKALEILKQCDDYVDAMSPYFEQIRNGETFLWVATKRNNSTISVRIPKNKKYLCLSYSGDCFAVSHVVKEKNYFFSPNASVVGLGIQELLNSMIDNGWTFEDFKEDFNKWLVDLITEYNLKTDEIEREFDNGVTL